MDFKELFAKYCELNKKKNDKMDEIDAITIYLNGINNDFFDGEMTEEQYKEKLPELFQKRIDRIKSQNELSEITYEKAKIEGKIRLILRAESVPENYFGQFLAISAFEKLLEANPTVADDNQKTLPLETVADLPISE